ncbi:hypothetical protein GQ53DRAFT_664083 [Thozetella sp. PMI_491]|nr:hypothetical protein GQ53DRAFT_664083 [Thozetella sp. PMI_491]
MGKPEITTPPLARAVPNRLNKWPLRLAVFAGFLVGFSYLCITEKSWFADLGHRLRFTSAAVDVQEHRPHRHYSPGIGKEWLRSGNGSVYGQFPKPNDPFQFLPCTRRTVPPALNDTHPAQTWSDLFDPDPSHWSWGNTTTSNSTSDPYAGRGIYLCGYLDVPLDYTNKSDTRIARLAVTKYQVSGLARAASLPGRALIAQRSENAPAPGTKSERTIVIEPGGPGGSGTRYAWSGAEGVTKRLSGGKFDVLGWDPRGVNASLPAIACFPFNADRDRWSLALNQHIEVSPDPKAYLAVADAFNDATFRACKERHGDLPRFMTTAFVARDLEEIRKAIGEDDLTGYLVSYGTGIGQTYVNMFPNSSGRIILDGTEYQRDHRLLGGFGWTALDNGTNAWHDGFLGECLKAGPSYCALAQPRNGKAVTLEDLESRMKTLITSLITRPVPVYTMTSGPGILTYSLLIPNLYSAMYSATSWPTLAKVLYELEGGNATLAAALVEGAWEYTPKQTCSPEPVSPSSDELGTMVICGDAYDAPLPPGGDTIAFYAELWANMTSKSWIAGNSRFYNIFPCRNFAKYWPKPAEVYRGNLNNTLKHPILLIAETYDPATPLRNGRRLLAEMGQNARLIAHHGYGHSSRDTSNCTDAIAKAFILEGKVPADQETACFANEKPYLYGVKQNSTSTPSTPTSNDDPMQAWREHLREMSVLSPGLLPVRS